MDIRKELIKEGYIQVENDNDIRDVYQKGDTFKTVVIGENEIEWVFVDGELI